MKLTFVKGKTLPIGVDLGTGAVKLAQLHLVDGNVELLAVGSAEIPTSCRNAPKGRMDFLAESIRDILGSNPFRNRQCVLSVPAEATFVHHVKLPTLPPSHIDMALRRELEGKLPYPVDDAIIRHLIAGQIYGDGDAKQEVIVFAIARQTLDGYLSMTRRARLDVIGVNVESCAIVECFARLFRRSGDASHTILFVDMGAASTQVVLSQAEKIVFARNLAIGGEVLDRAVADALGITVEQANSFRRDLLKGKANGATEKELYHMLEGPVGALADELTQCLRYYESVFRNQSVERVIFVGGQANDKRLCQAIAQRLNLPAQIGDPLMRIGRANGAGLGIGLDRRDAQPQWAVAVGLSLGAAKAA